MRNHRHAAREASRSRRVSPSAAGSAVDYLDRGFIGELRYELQSSTHRVDDSPKRAHLKVGLRTTHRLRDTGLSHMQRVGEFLLSDLPVSPQLVECHLGWCPRLAMVAKQGDDPLGSRPDVIS